MDHKTQEEIITSLEPLLEGVRQLESVLGPAAGPLIGRLQQRLIEAMAARDRGDMPAVLERIGGAMKELTQLAGTIDPQEAMLMRMVAENFGRALSRGDESSAKQQAAVMMERSGAVERKKPS